MHVPSVGHEAVVQVFDERPELVGVVLGSLGFVVPDGVPRVVDSSLSARQPLELHADHVFLIGDGADGLVVVVEAQTAPPSWRKWRTWAAYQAIAARRHDRAALVLVFALRGATARACRRQQPFSIGPGSEMSVALIGPDELAGGPPPGVGEAQWAVLAVACSAIDLDTPAGRSRALDTFARAAAGDLGRYYKLILAMASERAIAALEALMAIEYRETIVDRLLAEGREQGEEIGRQESARWLLLVVLDARGIGLPAGVREGVLACPDTDLLGTWAGRAATASTLAEVFGEQLSDWS